MSRRILFLTFLSFWLGASGPAPAALSTDAGPESGTVCAIHQQDFRNGMRKLWEDHVVWTRLFLVSAAAGLGDKDLVLQRLLRNQQDIGTAMKVFYGHAAGDRISALLTEHIVIAGDIVTNLMQHNRESATRAVRKWHVNADEIAKFLSDANPAWKFSDLRTAMYHHLKHTQAEVTAHLAQDWAGSIQAYDEVHDQILVMADRLSDGIQKQFPNRFCSACGI